MQLYKNSLAPLADTTVPTYDAIVVGAGPYGLSVAAHLRSYGLEVAIFGQPFSLWRDNMPEGMLLRSFWWASNLSDPYQCYGMAQYFSEIGKEPPASPLAREDFIAYGDWFQRYVVPTVDTTYVATIEREEEYFRVMLVDGRVLHCASVVMAVGLGYYAYRPVEYDGFAESLVSHSSEHASFEHFADRRVVILGGGQSALESAALLHESGARVSIVARHPIRWLTESTVEERSVWERLRHPRAGIAPGWFNWGLEAFPYMFQRLPRETRDRLLRGRGSFGPAGSGWLKPRLLPNVTFYEGQTVQNVSETSSDLAITLSNGTRLRADHLLLATGYQVNLWKLPMLSLELLAKIQLYHNAPRLSNQFESSVPGLYFVGISSVSSCGPLFRFVVGTDAAARRVSYAILRTLPALEQIGLLA